MAVSKQLYGPGRVPLEVRGAAREVLCYGDRTAAEDIYVVKNLHTSLLSRSASVSLQLVARLDSIDLDTVKKTYPKLYEGLGLVQKEYTIKLKADAQPFALKTPQGLT